MSRSPVEDVFDTLPPGLLSETLTEQCVSCGNSGLLGFFEVEDIPAQSTLLVDTREAAESLGGASLLLALCPVCGLIQNTRFSPDLIDYSLPTEESQAFSGVFDDYARDLAARLVRSYDLMGGTVLEIGSGKGDFLEVLAGSGIGSAVGIDPGYLPERGPEVGNVEFRREWYGVGHTHETADLVLARHLLEHVPNVGEFLGWLAESTSRTEGGVLFVEVPDTTRVLAEGAFWDVYHEHCVYFTTSSLEYAPGKRRDGSGRPRACVRRPVHPCRGPSRRKHVCAFRCGGCPGPGPTGRAVRGLGAKRSRRVASTYRRCDGVGE